MTLADQIEIAVIHGAERALRRAAKRAAARCAEVEGGAAAEKHRRDANAWAACADDVEAMLGDVLFPARVVA